MDREEAMTSLLSDSDDGLEMTVYQKTNGSSSKKKGGLLRKKNKGSMEYKGGWLVKCALGLSFLLNLTLFIILVLSKNTANEWSSTGEFDSSCTPLKSSSQNHPPSSSPISQSTSPSVSSKPSLSNEPLLPTPSSSSSKVEGESFKNGEGLETSDIHATLIPKSSQSQQQQQQQKHQNAEGASCAPDVPTVPPCGAGPERDEDKKGEKTEDLHGKKGYENVFADLTQEEIQAAHSYLVKTPALSVPRKCTVMGLELHTPNKTAALLFLDSYGPKPPREAQVLLACEHSTPPMIKEIIVGPLPDVKYYRDNPRRKDSKVPFNLSPNYGMVGAYKAVYQAYMDSPGLQKIVSESYGVKSLLKCQTKCLKFLAQKTSSAYNENVVYTLAAYYAVEFITINPVDLVFVAEETKTYGKDFTVTAIYYGGQTFFSTTQLITAYESGAVRKTRMTFPAPPSGQDSVAGTMNLRGSIFPSEPKAGPKSFEPDGKRYTIKDQHVNYLKWSFNLRLSKASGPQLWDVKWGDERVAYEISLQDVAVLYAGANPMSFYAHLSDSAFGLGNKAHGLLPGLDCPEGATYLSNTGQAHTGKPRQQPRAQCVFEHNTERPLRRHRNFDGVNGFNQGGVVDRVLIVRTIIVEYNYDYIFDMIFHQNGALELKTFATGYVMSQHYYNGENPFGFKINSESVGSIHHHIFNYKIDLDILGASNRYESLDLGVDERPWPWYHQGQDPFKQISFQHNLRETEMQAVLRYDYSQPKYHIFYNDEMKNEFGNHRAYRIATKGFSKQILPDDSPVLNSRRWAKYDMLVTRRKDTEETSSSIFSMFDGVNPHVDIDRYIEDNETIVDEDLVLWVTVGMHHIPHTEDIPNTPTIGTEASILLTPFNYFKECPSVGSRDSIRFDNIHKTPIRKDYGISWSKVCVPKQYDFEDLFSP